MSQFVSFEVPMGRDNVTHHPVDPEAQKMELLDRYQRSTQVVVLLPGQLCREKRGLTTFVHDPVLIFWRWLDDSKRQDRQIAKDHIKHQLCSKVDCLVAYLEDDSKSVRVIPSESWRLEHLPDTMS